MIREEDVERNAEFVISEHGADQIGWDKGTRVICKRDELDGDGEFWVEKSSNSSSGHWLDLEDVDYPNNDRRATTTLIVGSVVRIKSGVARQRISSRFTTVIEVTIVRGEVDSDGEFYVESVSVDSTLHGYGFYINPQDLEGPENQENNIMTTPNLSLNPAKAIALLQDKRDEFNKAYNDELAKLSTEDAGRENFTQRYVERMQVIATGLLNGDYDLNRYGEVVKVDGGAEVPPEVVKGRSADQIVSAKAQLETARATALRPFTTKMATIGATAGEVVELEAAEFERLSGMVVTVASF